jgi:hypothetical protein
VQVPIHTDKGSRRTLFSAERDPLESVQEVELKCGTLEVEKFSEGIHFAALVTQTGGKLQYRPRGWGLIPPLSRWFSSGPSNKQSMFPISSRMERQPKVKSLFRGSYPS